jgi:hypothetical protein
MDLRERIKMRTFGSGFAGGLVPVPEGDKTSNLYRARMVQNKLRDILIKFFDAVDEVTANNELTDVGKNRKLREVGKDYLGQIEKLKTEAAYLPPIEKQLEDLQRQIAPPISEDEQQNLAKVMRELEVQKFLLTKDETERIVILFKACKLGDELTYGAALHSPKVFELFGEDHLEQARQQWAQLRMPAIYDEYQRLKEARDLVLMNIVEAENDIRSQCGLPAKDFPREVIDIIDDAEAEYRKQDENWPTKPGDRDVGPTPGV